MKETRYTLIGYGILVTILIVIFSYLILDVTKTAIRSNHHDILTALLNSTSVTLRTNFKDTSSSEESRLIALRSSWATLTNTRIGKTGETYLVSKNGILLSPSRYRENLIKSNRITDQISEAENFKLEVPGGKSNIMLDQISEGKDGCQLAGYADYRGTEVIGC